MYNKNRLWLPIVQYSFCRKTKETGQHTQGRNKNAYSGTFKTSQVESLHVKANDPPFLELRRNELGLRFLYKLKISTSYIINILDDSKDQNYGSVAKKTGTYIYIWMNRRNKLDTITIVVKIIILLWKRIHGEWQQEKAALPTIRRKNSNNKETYMDCSKNIQRKVGFAAVFAYMPLST